MPRGVYERPSAEDRFWPKVNKNSKSDCWQWTASLNRYGYGRLNVNGTMMLAHRFSYELHKGLISEGMHVLHSCDNPKCVNPTHLSVGTHVDNIRDKVIKNRQYRPTGEKHHLSKLNEEKVKEIKNKINLGIKQTDIAKEYNITVSAISLIKTGRRWAHIN